MPASLCSGLVLSLSHPIQLSYTSKGAQSDWLYPAAFNHVSRSHHLSGKTCLQSWFLVYQWELVPIKEVPTVFLLDPLLTLDNVLSRWLCSLASQELPPVPVLARCCCGKAQTACPYSGSCLHQWIQSVIPAWLYPVRMQVNRCCSPAGTGMPPVPALMLISRSSGSAEESLHLPYEAVTSPSWVIWVLMGAVVQPSPSCKPSWFSVLPVVIMNWPSWPAPRPDPQVCWQIL